MGEKALINKKQRYNTGEWFVSASLGDVVDLLIKKLSSERCGIQLPRFLILELSRIKEDIDKLESPIPKDVDKNEYMKDIREKSKILARDFRAWLYKVNSSTYIPEGYYIGQKIGDLSRWGLWKKRNVGPAEIVIDQTKVPSDAPTPDEIADMILARFEKYKQQIGGRENIEDIIHIGIEEECL